MLLECSVDSGKAKECITTINLEFYQD